MLASISSADIPTRLEAAAILGMPCVSVGAALKELDASNYVQANWIDQIPGSDHLSSIAGSYVFGGVGSAITTTIANHLRVRGNQVAAERVQKAGNAVTMIGSLACQVAIETSTKGTGDTWDVVSGVVATIPGVVAGRGWVKSRTTARVKK